MTRQTLPQNTSKRKAGIKPTMYGSRQRIFRPITSEASRPPMSSMQSVPSPFQELEIVSAQKLQTSSTNILTPPESNPIKIRFRVSQTISQPSFAASFCHGLVPERHQVDLDAVFA